MLEWDANLSKWKKKETIGKADSQLISPSSQVQVKRSKSKLQFLSVECKPQSYEVLNVQKKKIRKKNAQENVT